MPGLSAGAWRPATTCRGGIDAWVRTALLTDAIRRYGGGFMFRRSILLYTSCAVLLPCAGAGNVFAEIINLEWRVAQPFVRVGDTIDAGLYVVLTTETSPGLAGVQAIFSWDPSVLAIAGLVSTGNEIPWMSSFFPPDQDADRLNADCGPDLFCPSYTGIPFNDGDAFFFALAAFLNNEPLPLATPEGSLVATVRFSALSDVVATELRFLATSGMVAVTQISAIDPVTKKTLPLLPELAPATFAVAACGTKADFDADCVVRLNDVTDFSPCVFGPDVVALASPCGVADMDDDGDVDLRDVAMVQLVFEGGP